MGWSSSALMQDVIRSTKRHFKGKTRVAFYEDLIGAFEKMDCDTLYECCGVDKDFDVALENARSAEVVKTKER